MGCEAVTQKLTLTSTTCPYCGSDLRGTEIPERDREAFGGATHYLRVIGIYDMEQDRTVAARCPDCGKQDAR